MNLANILWDVGILSVILLFGVKIGLAMGFAGLSRKILIRGPTRGDCEMG